MEVKALSAKSVLVLFRMFLVFSFLLPVYSEGADQLTANKYYQEGLQLSDQTCVSDGFDLQDCRRAVKDLENAIKLAPKDPRIVDAHLALARGYWNISFLGTDSEQEQKSLRDRALTLALNAANLNPKSAKSLYDASIYANTDTERIDLLSKVIERDPKHPEAHGRIAKLLLARGDVNQAFKEYIVQLDISPRLDSEKGFNHVSFAQSLTRVGRLEEAVKIMEKVITFKEPTSELCSQFSTLDLKPYTAFGEFVDKIQKLKQPCAETQKP